MKAGLCSLKVAVWNTHAGTRSPDVSTPMRIELPEGISIQTFVLRQRVAYGVGANGEVYVWGSHSLSQEQESTFFSLDVRFLQGDPREFVPLKSQRVITISCNSMVAFFVTDEGVLYSYGNDLVHKFGILAQDDVFNLYSPMPVRSLLGRKIKQVSVGNSHACAWSTLGTLFVWGEGRRGQLGLEGVDRIKVPTQIPSLGNVKQACAMTTATIILTGGGKTFISGSLRPHFPDSALWQINESEILAEPREVDSLANNFIVKISHGEQSLACLTKEGEVLWVSVYLSSYKMGAKHIIKDIQCVEGKIFGMDEEGKHLYEWLPTLDERKTGDLYTISTCNYKTHIFEIDDKNLKYIGFCDVTTGSMAAMYFTSHFLREATLLKPNILEQTAHSQSRRKESPTSKKDFRNKFKRTLGINSVERSGERSREGIAQKTFQNELFKKKSLFPTNAKGEFKAGVEAFKEYLSAKRQPRTAAHSSHPSLGGVAIRLMEHPSHEDVCENSNKEELMNRKPNKKSSKNLYPPEELPQVNHNIRTKQRLNQLGIVFKRQLQLLKERRGKSVEEQKILQPYEKNIEGIQNDFPNNKEVEYSRMDTHFDQNPSIQNSQLSKTPPREDELDDRKQEETPMSMIEPLILTREAAVVGELDYKKGIENIGGIIRKKLLNQLHYLNSKSFEKKCIEDGTSRIESVLRQVALRTGLRKFENIARQKKAFEDISTILENMILKEGFRKLKHYCQMVAAVEKLNLSLKKKLLYKDIFIYIYNLYIFL